MGFVTFYKTTKKCFFVFHLVYFHVIFRENAALQRDRMGRVPTISGIEKSLYVGTVRR